MKNTMSPLLALIAALAIAGIIMDRARKLEPARAAPTYVEATIVGVFQSQNGDWWTTLSWGESDRGSWNSKLGKEGDLVKIYPARNGRYSITPNE